VFLTSRGTEYPLAAQATACSVIPESMEVESQLPAVAWSFVSSRHQSAIRVGLVQTPSKSVDN